MANETLNELRKRMAALWEETDKCGYKLEDILSVEVQTHTPSERVKALVIENMQLKKDFKAAKQQAESEIQYCLNQRDRDVEFYRNLARGEEQRADREKNHHAKILEDLEATREQRRASVENDYKEYKRIIEKLMAKINALSAITRYYEGTDSVVTMCNEVQDPDMSGYLLEALKKQEDDLEKCGEIEKVYADLLDRLERENDDRASVLNRQTESMRQHDQSLSAAVSEVKVLERYYHQVSNVLSMYKNFFEHLLSPNTDCFMRKPPGLKGLMKIARQDCADLEALHEIFSVQNLEKGEVREKLDGLRLSAYQIQLSLECITRCVVLFSGTLEAKTDMWSSIRKRLQFQRRSI